MAKESKLKIKIVGGDISAATGSQIIADQINLTSEPIQVNLSNDQDLIESQGIELGDDQFVHTFAQDIPSTFIQGFPVLETPLETPPEPATKEPTQEATFKKPFVPPLLEDLKTLSHNKVVSCNQIGM
jgi:hypothetical protein